MRQILAIKEGVWPVLSYKLERLTVVKWFLNWIWAIPGVMIIRIIRPWLVVRMTEIFSERIGHFSTDALKHLSRQVLRFEQGRILDYR